ncbi:MarR family winged helix-turn-helix transcriptional regulator [Chitinophaga qingshengii]|uniref:Winged helix DNA-binding protein n=1 Tax=Chitinophaga qingshengii TaxID=1569794 RepID=A0ABR7TWH9_9BACT|nr:MarR family transcriptional regulator [Chitinophaga qingshengii]MBC9934787.1 winged helix DNA-binding protein [Chitinophaga qingshengii]
MSTIEERYEASLIRRTSSLGRLLSLVKKDVDQRLTEKLVGLGHRNFRAGDMVVLINIDDAGTINNELAKKARISKQAMSKVVKNLEADGYIATRKHDTDNRASLIFLTDKGKMLLIEASESIKEIEAGYTDVVGEQDITTLKQVLLRLHEGLRL